MSLVGDLLYQQELKDQINLLTWVIELCYDKDLNKENSGAYIKSKVEEKIKDIEDWSNKIGKY